jgi:cytochrome c-type biogenesis protein
MGLHFAGVFRIPLLYREARFQVRRPVGLWGAYVMGLAFAFGWTPCLGPVLATVLTVAAAEATVTKGAALLALYAAGLGLPFVIAAFAMKPFVGFLARFRHHLGAVEKAMGALLVLAGVAFLTGWMTDLSFWLLDSFPALGQLG